MKTPILQPLLKRLNTLKGNHKRTAVALFENVTALAAKFGIQRLGFLTLTFADKVTDAKEAQRRFKSLRTAILEPRYAHYVRVIERQKSGRLHYHLLVVLKEDIRTGFDFQSVNRGDYRSANSALRAEWSFWRSTAKKYGFGRTELLPVKSNSEGIARYVGKYISKHIGERIEADKGARLVEYSRATRQWSSHFGWNTEEARLWRVKCASVAEVMGVGEGTMHKAIGSRWAFKFQDIISRVRPHEYWDGFDPLLDSPPCNTNAEEVIKRWEEGRNFRITPVEAVGEIAHQITHRSWQKVRDMETGEDLNNSLNDPPTPQAQKQKERSGHAARADERDPFGIGGSRARREGKHVWPVGTFTTRKPEGFPVAHSFENGPSGARRRTNLAKGSPHGAALAHRPDVADTVSQLEFL